MGLASAAEMLERRREPRKAPPPETIQRPQGQRIRGYGSSLLGLRRGVCRKSTGESGGIQAPGACGPGLQGAWGPGPQGLGPGPLQKPPKPLKLRFFANLLVGAWRRRGCRLMLRRWGPGGKRSRDTPPTPPLPAHPTFWGSEEGFPPLRLRQPSNTPPKVGGLAAHEP